MRSVTTRIELTGRLIRKPAMRVTPAGTHTLTIEVNCGDEDEIMVLKVVRVGDEVPELARQLKDGGCLKAVGKLRMARAGSQIEVLADHVTVESGETKRERIR